MSDFRIDQITNQAGTAGPQIAGITTFSSTSGLVMPSGATEYRGGRGRGLFGGGANPTNTNIINYVTISTSSNAYDFGDLIERRGTLGSCASSTRGLWAGAWASAATPARSNTIDYVTISSTGNAFDFGDLTRTRELVATSNSVRGVFAGGADLVGPTVVTLNIIDYVIISSLGNASSFGDLFTGRYGLMSCSSNVRGIFSGGSSNLTGFTGQTNVIQYITIASTGNSQDFGDLTVARRYGAGCSNSIRGLFCAGDTPAQVDTIDYITITSTGDAIDFGDSTDARLALSACSNGTRGLFAGGASPTVVNLIEFVTILTLGNAQDFGDLTSLQVALMHTEV
jgi:hypothetical protein